VEKDKEKVEKEKVEKEKGGKREGEGVVGAIIRLIIDYFCGV
jgi:hypothetical protein